MKNMAFMGMGMMAVLAYQKYKDPMLKMMKKAMNKEKQMINETLENMM